MSCSSHRVISRGCYDAMEDCKIRKYNIMALKVHISLLGKELKSPNIRYIRDKIITI